MVLGAGIAAAACAAPTRRLTPRVVEDPLVLPRRLASFAVDAGVSRHEPAGNRSFLGGASFRMGLTDRLEWTDLLSLRYALLDDRPADGRPARPLSLAVRAGLLGFGYSSASGIIVVPTASVDALKHVGDRWALSLSAAWTASWVERRGTYDPSYTVNQTSHTIMALSVSATVTRQLSERVALGVFVTGFEDIDCPGSCRFVARGANAGLFAGVRPWHWLTLSAGPSAGVRQRTETVVLVTPSAPPSILRASTNGCACSAWRRSTGEARRPPASRRAGAPRRSLAPPPSGTCGTARPPRPSTPPASARSRR